MILWREKLIAFAVHFLVTLALAGLAAALIFFVWFPDPFQTMVGGSKLFVLIVACDLALGPLISLVIYNSKKPRKELVFDYAVVGVVQLAALIYGVSVVFDSRPAYVVFVKDRLEVITANEIAEEDLRAANNSYSRLPKFGLQLVAAEVPPEEENEVLFQALEGKDVSVRPKFYVPYESQADDVRDKAEPLATLEQRHPSSKTIIESAIATMDVPEDRLLWIPVKHRRGFWTALVDAQTGYPLQYLNIDPY